LDGRISDNDVPPEKIPFHSRRKKDTVCVSKNRILLDYVPGIDRSRKTNAEV
jgi:hypothetical protein